MCASGPTLLVLSTPTMSPPTVPLTSAVPPTTTKSFSTLPSTLAWPPITTMTEATSFFFRTLSWNITTTSLRRTSLVSGLSSNSWAVEDTAIGIRNANTKGDIRFQNIRADLFIGIIVCRELHGNRPCQNQDRPNTS